MKAVNILWSNRARWRIPALTILSCSFLLLGCPCKSTTAPDGPQYDPRNISRTEEASVGPSIAVGPDGTVYAVWMDGAVSEYDTFQIYFKSKLPEGEWSTAEILSYKTENSWDSHMVSDPSGCLHVVWWEAHSDYLEWNIKYCQRLLTGDWSNIEVLSGEGAEQPRIAVDPSGTIHVIYQQLQIFYMFKPSGGNWSSPIEIASYGINPVIAAGDDGSVHVVYEAGEEIFLVTGSPFGNWSEPVNVSQSSWYSLFANVGVDHTGRVWVIWTEVDHQVWGTSTPYYSILENSIWSQPDFLPFHGEVSSKVIVFPENKPIYIFADGRWGGDIEVYQEIEGHWENVMNFGTLTGGSLGPKAIVDLNGRVHVLWQEWENLPYGKYEIYYDSFVP
jgi:hypothetical protein